MPSLDTSIPAQFARHVRWFPERREALAELERFLATPGDWTARSNPHGHVVASGIVTDGKAVLLIEHRFLQRWLQPGGHVDAGEAPSAAAVREVLEETGVAATRDAWHEREGCPFDIDVHRIPVNPRKGEGAHFHFDFRYLLRVPEGAATVAQVAEVTGVAWFPWDEAVARVEGLDRVREHGRRLGLLA